MECLVKLVQELLPKVSESIAERLLASLLQNQDFWKAACGRDRFLPLADRRNLDIFKQSSSFELPQDKLACLGHMSEVGIQSPRLEQCRADYSKAAVATDASAFLVAHFEKTWAKPDQPTAEELMETITAMECPLSNLMVDLKKLESCTPADMFTEITKLLGTTVVDPLFCEMLPHFEQLLTAATKNIPPNYENWLVGRNVAKVKQCMFQKEVHMAICGSLEAFTKIVATFERAVKDLTALNMMGLPQLARMKSVASQMKSLRCYSTTVHGFLASFRLAAGSLFFLLSWGLRQVVKGKARSDV